MIKIFVPAVVVIITIACNDNRSASVNGEQQNNSSIPKTLSDSLYKVAMEGHDIGMAKMGEIARYRKLVKHKIDSVAELKSKVKLQPLLDSALKRLQYAEDLMNHWMQDFDPDKAGNTEAEKVDYYRGEKEKIDTVNARIFKSIETAKALVDE